MAIRQEGFAMRRLSSGFRINFASDDAAGLAISEIMRAQIRGLDQAVRNIQDSQSLIQVADRGMYEIGSMLTRIRELTVQAANDTLHQRELIQTEIEQLIYEIDSVARRTTFNGIPLLDGTLAPPPHARPQPTTGFSAVLPALFVEQEIQQPQSATQIAPVSANASISPTAFSGPITEIDVRNNSGSGVGWSWNGNQLYIYGGGNFRIVDSLNPNGDTPAAALNRRITVSEGTSANIILAGVNLVSNDGAALDARNANVNLHIEDGTVNTLQGRSQFAGIATTGGNVVITGNTGRLTAIGGDTGAGIGGGRREAGGNLTIYGGYVTARGGGQSAAGIGGGAGASAPTVADGGNFSIDGGTINIHGGTVRAYGSGWGAGIGGGGTSEQFIGGVGGDITITGGTVYARGGATAAGIGGGRNADGGNITITGGTVNAWSGTSAAAIGGGRGGAGGNIRIEGGTVNATGAGEGAGIGGGRDGIGGNITIVDGNVTAVSGNNFGAAIGGGSFASGGVITIYGGTIDARAQGNRGAGIGGGRDGAGSIINIHGGDIIARGATGGAGIGSGRDGEASTILITGGTIDARGGLDGAGIGGGQGVAGGVITIEDGVIRAQGGNRAAGIGGGNNGNGGVITVSGGHVTAIGGNNASGIGGGRNTPGAQFTMFGGTVEVLVGRIGRGGATSGPNNNGSIIYHDGSLFVQGVIHDNNNNVGGAARVPGGVFSPDGTQLRAMVIDLTTLEGFEHLNLGDEVRLSLTIDGEEREFTGIVGNRYFTIWVPYVPDDPPEIILPEEPPEIADPEIRWPNPNLRPGQAMWFQTGANSFHGMLFNIRQLDAYALGLRDAFGDMYIDVAQESGVLVSPLLNIIDNAISQTSSERARIGAVYNRLTHTSRVNEVSSQNLSDAESRLRDADLAREAIRLTKANMRRQASITVMAQTNNIYPHIVYNIINQPTE